MKKFVLILAATAILFGCKKKDEGVFRDPDSPIYIYGVDNPNKAATERKNVHEILTTQKGDIVLRWSLKTEPICGSIAFTHENGKLDTINDRLIMEAVNVIMEGNIMNELGGLFLKGRNYYLIDLSFVPEGELADTLGYIPNSVIRSAQADILDLWREGAIAEIYERFNESFYFTPCSGEEFRAIKEEIDWENEYNDLLPRHAETHLIRWD